ncbi:MAG: hypothetical protein IKD65_02570 [Oscillospiraceae bacterium]|nr:hypothetical protein [Oscillospiraceae bacterium]
MKDPMRLIDRFCYKHPNFGIPNLMRYLTIANVAFWILGAANSTLLSYLSFDAALILRGQVWRLLTFMLYPPSMGMLAFLVFYFYYWMGSTLERYWGTPQFNVYILIGWALTVVYGFLVYFLGGYRIRIDAQYLYLSMFFSYAALFPDQMVLLFFIIPIKMKYLALIDAVYFVMAVVSNPFPVNLLPVVAVLNFFLFFYGALLRLIPKKPSNSTINFRKASRKIRQEEQNRLYHHKCAVCGRTDTEYPGLEFRYCSRCAGYHCFCADHINNHIHFTE